MHCFTRCLRLVGGWEDSLDLASRVSSILLSCAGWRCFSSPGQGRHNPLLLVAPQENILPAVVEAALAIDLEGISCDWL